MDAYVLAGPPDRCKRFGTQGAANPSRQHTVRGFPNHTMPGMRPQSPQIPTFARQTVNQTLPPAECPCACSTSGQTKTATQTVLSPAESPCACSASGHPGRPQSRRSRGCPSGTAQTAVSVAQTWVCALRGALAVGMHALSRHRRGNPSGTVHTNTYSWFSY